MSESACECICVSSSSKLFSSPLLLSTPQSLSLTLKRTRKGTILSHPPSAALSLPHQNTTPPTSLSGAPEKAPTAKPEHHPALSLSLSLSLSHAHSVAESVFLSLSLSNIQKRRHVAKPQQYPALPHSLSLSLCLTLSYYHSLSLSLSHSDAPEKEPCCKTRTSSSTFYLTHTHTVCCCIAQ